MRPTAQDYTATLFPDPAPANPALSPNLQKAMLDATPDCIKLLSTDGRLITMNKAGCVALGVPEDSRFGMPWLPLLAESARALGQEALCKAAEGHNARFPGQSGSAAETRYWDNLLTPIVDHSGRVVSILCVSRDITVKTLLERELEEAIGRERLLSREMQHRIKNLFSIVHGLSLIAETEANKDNAPQGAMRILREKLLALSRASDAVFGESNDPKPETDQAVDLNVLVSSLLRPYAGRYQTNGTAASISRNNTTILALFLHELATNSVKYGAFSIGRGVVTVHWTTSGNDLNLTWAESGGPHLGVQPRKRGFGSEMVDHALRPVGGQVKRTWTTEGLITELYLPNAGRAEAGPN